MASLSTEHQTQLLRGKSINLANYAERHWHPQLYLENALGDLKEQIKYSAKRNETNNTIYVCEHRIVKGLFWEKLELHHFPSDVQDLSISVTSMLSHNRVLLVPDPDHPSGVNREAFVDQQEWSLYEHIDTEQRYIEEFLFRTSHDEEDNDEEQQQQQHVKDRVTDDYKRSVLVITCHVGSYQERAQETVCFVLYYSSSISVLLLERIYSHSANHARLILCLWFTLTVSRPDSTYRFV